MSKENVTPIKPLRYDRKQRKFIPTNFREVVEIYGYPVIGKEVAKHVYYYRKGSPFALKCLEGLNTDGTPSKFRSRCKKYKFLTTAPFTISNRCCDIIKKHPLKQYERKTQNKPIIATMAYESQQRETGWLKTGCNSFKNSPMSKPMSFWTDQDVLRYLKITGIPYASVYGDIIEKGGQTLLFESESAPLVTTGCERTGCMFCMFGIMSDRTPNRFQRMKQTHPKLYEYCIGGGTYDENGMLKPDKHGLGIGKVLDFINIPY